jgi:hypothetical protein
METNTLTARHSHRLTAGGKAVAGSRYSVATIAGLTLRVGDRRFQE